MVCSLGTYTGWNDCCVLSGYLHWLKLLLCTLLPTLVEMFAVYSLHAMLVEIIIIIVHSGAYAGWNDHCVLSRCLCWLKLLLRTLVPRLVEMIAVCSLGAMLVEIIIIVHSGAYAGWNDNCVLSRCLRWLKLLLRTLVPALVEMIAVYSLGAVLVEMITVHSLGAMLVEMILLCTLWVCVECDSS